jgi:hypothetical protein
MTATGVHFCLWAPTAQTVKVVLFAQGCPTATYALNREEAGYWSTDVAGGGRGACYAFSDVLWPLPNIIPAEVGEVEDHRGSSIRRQHCSPLARSETP